MLSSDAGNIRAHTEQLNISYKTVTQDRVKTTICCSLYRRSRCLQRKRTPAHLQVYRRYMTKAKVTVEESSHDN